MEREREERARERASERERERDRERERETAIEGEHGRERERVKNRFETKEKICFALKSKKDLFLRFSKAKNSYFGISEAILFETVFETQKTIKK